MGTHLCVIYVVIFLKSQQSEKYWIYKLEDSNI